MYLSSQRIQRVLYHMMMYAAAVEYHAMCVSPQAFLIDQPNGAVEFVGNRTECALLMLLRLWKMDYAEVRKAWAARVVGVSLDLFGWRLSCCAVRIGIWTTKH